eukprot:sb/3473543/
MLHLLQEDRRLKVSVMWDVFPFTNLGAGRHLRPEENRRKPKKRKKFAPAQNPKSDGPIKNNKFQAAIACSIIVQSDPDLVTSSGERVLVTKSGWPLNRGQIPLISYIGGNIPFGSIASYIRFANNRIPPCPLHRPPRFSDQNSFPRGCH